MKTPYYLIDEKKLLRNLEIVRRLSEASGTKSLLALKCFAAWSVFGLIKKYMDGTTGSGVFEARLGREKFGKEVHVFCTGFSRPDIREARRYADTVIFNSISQLTAYERDVRGLQIGIRVNPGCGYSHFDLADPARRYSRLGIGGADALRKVIGRISGVLFHFNCENNDFGNYARNLDRIGRQYGHLLKRLEWVSLGGGVAFTSPGYPLEKLCERLRAFRKEYGVRIYLEPGEAVVTGSAELVTTVLDVVHNEKEIAIVDASLEAHMLDQLIYRTSPRIASPAPGRFKVMIAGRSCLAGDVFGNYSLKSRLKPGGVVHIADAAGYTMVKKNWFNGLPMPGICVRRLDGTVDAVRSFGYDDFKSNLS